MARLNRNWAMLRNLIRKSSVDTSYKKLWLKFWNSSIRSEAAHTFRHHNGSTKSIRPEGMITSWGENCRFPSSGIALGLVDQPTEDREWRYPPLVLTTGLCYLGAGIDPVYNLVGTNEFAGHIDWRASKRPLDYYLRDCTKVTSKFQNYHVLVNVKNVGVSLYKLHRNNMGYSLYKPRRRKEWRTHELVEITNRWEPLYEVLTGALLAILCNEKWKHVIIDDERLFNMIRTLSDKYGLYLDVHFVSGYDHNVSPTIFMDDHLPTAIASGRGISHAEAAAYLNNLELMTESIHTHYDLEEFMDRSSGEVDRILVMSLNNKYWAGALANALFEHDACYTLPVTLFTIPENN